MLYELSRFPAVRHDDQVDAMSVVAGELIKLSAPKRPQKTIVQQETVLGLKDGRLVLNQSLDDLFKSNEHSHKKRFSNLRI